MSTFTSVFSAKRTTRYLFVIILTLGLLHFIGLTLSCLTQSNAVINAVKLVNLDRERNLPTLFNVFLFVFNAGLCLIIYRNSKTFREPRRAWVILGSVFAFLSLDEFGSIHEQLSEPIRNTFSTSGIFHHAWVIPYGLLAIGIAALTLPTILKLRSSIRKWFILAAVLYITGAIGFEMIGALDPSMITGPNFLYGSLVAGEELLEMAGLTVLSHGLITLLEKQYGGLTLIIPNHYKNTKPYTNYNIPVASPANIAMPQSIFPLETR